jgi:Tol biopolymer transport system component
VRIAPDSSRVLYVADQDTDEVFELYSVPIGGGAAVRLGPAMHAGGDVFTSSFNGPPHRAYAFTPDSARVLLVVDAEQDEVLELYSTPADGSTPAVKLNGALQPQGDVISYAITADSTGVVYRADERDEGLFELFLVPADGSRTPIRLNPPMAKPGCTNFFQLTPDSLSVLYEATERAGVNELFASWLPEIPKLRHAFGRKL